MAYNHAERRALGFLLLTTVFLWILFGFFWSILLVFTLLVLAFSVHRDSLSRGLTDETVDGEKEDFHNDIPDVPFTDVLKTQRPSFTIKSPAPLLSEVTRTLNFNVSRVTSPNERSFQRGQLTKPRRRFGTSGQNDFSPWRQSGGLSPSPIQGNVSFSQLHSPNYFSVLNQQATVKIAAPDYAGRGFLESMENTRSLVWQERRQSPCSRETVLSALRGVRKRSVLDEDEDADDYLKLRKKSRYSKHASAEAVAAVPTSLAANQNGMKRTLPTKTLEEENNGKARKKMREDARDEQPDETNETKGKARQKRGISSPLSEQLERGPVQHSTPLVDTNSERSKRKKAVHKDTADAETRSRAKPIDDGDIIMGEILEGKTEHMRAGKTEKNSLQQETKKSKKALEVKNAGSPREDKPKKDESCKKYTSSVKKDDPRRRSVPVYCAPSDGMDLPPRRLAANHINQEHFKHDRKAAWERVKWLLDDDEDEEEESNTAAQTSTPKSQNAPVGTSSAVSRPTLTLVPAASSVTQQAPGLVTLLTSPVQGKEKGKSQVQPSVCTGSTVIVSSVNSAPLTATLTLGSVAGQSQVVSTGKAVTTTTQSIVAPVASVPLSNITAASTASLGFTGASTNMPTTKQPSLGTASPFAFGLKRTPPAGVSVSSSSGGFSFGGTKPPADSALSAAPAGFSLAQSALSSVNTTTQPTAGLGQPTPAAGTLGSLAPASSGLLAKSTAAQYSLSTNTSVTQGGFAFNPSQPAQSVFGSTTAAATQKATLPSSSAAQSAFASIPNTSQVAFGSALGSTQNTPGASSTQSAFGAHNTQKAFGSALGSTQNAPGASSTQSAFGAHNTQKAFGSALGSTQNAPGASSTQSAFGAHNTQKAFGSALGSTQNAPGASSTQSAFGASNTQKAFGSALGSTQNAPGASSTQSAFGASNTQKAFGSASSTAQNTVGGNQGVFGTAASPAQNAFGMSSNTQSAFAPTQNAFGGASQPVFGSAVTPASNTFGASTQKPFATNSPKPAFGQTSQGAFGAPSTNQSSFAFNSGTGNQAPQNAFGSSQPANTGFAGSQTTGAEAFKFRAQTPGVAGAASLAGNQAAFQFGAKTQGGFGSTGSAGNQAGNSGFQAGSRPGFGSAPSAGGQAATNSSFKFAAQTQSGFGSTQTPTQNAFGSGTSQNAAGTSGGFNFGAGAQQTSGGFNFGSANPAASGGFNFGAQSRPGTPAPPGGFNFGASSSPFGQSAPANSANVATQRSRARLTARRRGKK